MQTSSTPGEASLHTSSVARGRSGLTLLELMIVTVILSILAMIAVRPLREARQNALIAAAKSEVREVIGAIARHQIVSGTLPPNVASLASEGYTPSRDILICSFRLRTERGRTTAILVQGRHVRSDRVVSVPFPGGRMIVLEPGQEQSSCAP